MKAALAALMLGLVLAVTGVPGQTSPARADIGFSFGFYGSDYYGPGFGIYAGSHRYYGRHGWRYGQRHYRRWRSPYYYYQPRFYGPRYYAPRSYRGGRCGIWTRRCAANWGWRNSNFRGCLRYHRC